MAAFKNKDNGTWYVQFRYTDWKGERKQKLKRGFATKREALEWEREFLMEKQADVNMTFESFVALYEKDIKPKLKLNTWLTKESIIKKKILPYFANRKLSEITAKDIIRWQNEIRELRDCHGKPLSKTYLKTVHNQLSAIFNHAARFYGLNINPARQAGNMGAEERKEMLFWTREEYTRFSEAMMDKPLSFYAFEILYWCGVREGELLALTPADFDFEKRTVSINKSYQRLNKKDVITTPKTPKSNRVIQMPQFLCDELQDYLKQLYGVEPDSRMFPISKSYLHREMGRGCKQTGVKRIRIHDLRHSHISLLIDMGFTALAIAERVGHESIDITYRYAHLFPTRQVEMADKLDSLKMRRECKKMSKKNYDNHNRWRNKTVAFRVSAEEDLQLETLVKLTGLTKQDYIIRRLLERDVVVQGNPKVYKALRDQLSAVLDELRRIEAGQGVNDELLDTIQMITTIMNGMQEEFAYDR